MKLEGSLAVTDPASDDSEMERSASRRYLCKAADLPRLISLLAENQHALGTIANSNVVHNLALKLLHRWRQNTRAGSKRNIHAHYDLGNRF